MALQGVECLEGQGNTAKRIYDAANLVTSTKSDSCHSDALDVLRGSVNKLTPPNSRINKIIIIITIILIEPGRLDQSIVRSFIRSSPRRRSASLAVASLDAQRSLPPICRPSLLSQFSRSHHPVNLQLHQNSPLTTVITFVQHHVRDISPASFHSLSISCLTRYIARWMCCPE